MERVNEARGMTPEAIGSIIGNIEKRDRFFELLL